MKCLIIYQYSLLHCLIKYVPKAELSRSLLLTNGIFTYNASCHMMLFVFKLIYHKIMIFNFVCVLKNLLFISPPHSSSVFTFPLSLSLFFPPAPFSSLLLNPRHFFSLLLTLYFNITPDPAHSSSLLLPPFHSCALLFSHPHCSSLSYFLRSFLLLPHFLQLSPESSSLLKYLFLSPQI